MKKTVLSIIVVAAITMMFGSCSSTKDIAYFKNSDTVSLEASKVLYDARIMPKDILTITVSTTEDEAAKPFNLTVPTAMNSSANRSLTNQPVLQNYLVDNEGYIDFPRIGRVKLLGMTKSQAEEYILGQIKPYMSETEKPIVTVRMANYKFSVLGEVNRPGMYTVSNEKICILEALAQAGDMTIYGVRNNVKLIREDENGQKSIHILNLNDANLINSPYYYLQQNDVVIVQPNKVKAQNSSVGSMTTLWFSATSILISLTSLLYNILQ
ncbi:MAG: polysaccharide biosynthesis/export family protein [Prevotella sp.]|nr:polysaccharide biosynthesis/export family protein [Prevotella sp.]MDD6978375.1 polysaccharide biosynthesis/export family protein [Prevotellaceae bacterium]MDY5124740.1 polysaccharide biosynthesis/export family protein [Prevotella sp.]MDY6198803.1 polysaccharide biosynthesis/export family protein [Prevotella sp.]